MEKNVSEKIVIFFHIYYVDVIDEYLWYLNNIKSTKYAFDLYVSLCEEVKTNETLLSDNIFKLNGAWFQNFISLTLTCCAK